MCVCVDESELKDCLLVLVDDQQKLSAQMAKSTLSAQRLRRRLLIMERYLISLSHSMMEEKYEVHWKEPPSPPLPAADNKRYRGSKMGILFHWSQNNKPVSLKGRTNWRGGVTRKKAEGGRLGRKVHGTSPSAGLDCGAPAPHSTEGEGSRASDRCERGAQSRDRLAIPARGRAMLPFRIGLLDTKTPLFNERLPEAAVSQSA